MESDKSLFEVAIFFIFSTVVESNASMLLSSNPFSDNISFESLSIELLKSSDIFSTEPNQEDERSKNCSANN